VNAKGGRVWAYIGTLMGVSVSSGANLIETLNNDAVPQAWAMVAAIFMGLLPVGLFVSLEVLVRNHIKDHINWWRAGMMLAATSFAVPSYLHMHWLMIDWGQGDIIATVYPVGWDAMMLLSTLALLLDPAEMVGRRKQPVKPVKVKRDWLGRKKPAVAALATNDVEDEETETEADPPAPPPPPAPPKPPKARPVPVATTQRRLKRDIDPLYAQFVARHNAGKPMTPEELEKLDGKGINSARSKINRWRKTI
jgi:hypothetical protein